MTSELETNLVSVERVEEYSETQTEVTFIMCGQLRSNWSQHGSSVSRFCFSSSFISVFNLLWMVIYVESEIMNLRALKRT